MRVAADDGQERQRKELEARFQHSVQAIEGRLVGATAAISGLQGLFAVTEPSRSDFQTYFSFVQDIEGIKALEYTRVVPASERDSFIKAVREDRSLIENGYPDFTIATPTSYEDMFVVDYVEPMAGNETAFGFDLGSNPAQRAAIEKARDTGEIVASEGIQLVQDAESRYGFLLMLPVYDGGGTPPRIEERRDQFLGVVNGVFIVENLLDGIAGAGSTIDLTIYDSGSGDGPPAAWPVLYSTGQPQAVPTPQNSDVTLSAVELEVTVGDRMWTIIGVEGPETLISSGTASLPMVFGVVGMLITIAAAVTAFAIMDSRGRANEAARLATIDLQKQAESLRAARDEALKADRLKTAFLANMSHELRTPLNGVIGLSSVLDNETFGVLNDKQHDYVRRISNSGDLLLSLINDLLDLARIEAGKEELIVLAVDLGQVVTESIDLVQADADIEGVTISGVYPKEGVVVMADRRRLKQVLLNLLSNAVKFTHSGGSVRVEVTASESQAEIVVSDTGIGIPDHELEKVFEPFHQVDSTMARAKDGSGLGLTLSARLIHMHGGDVTVQSEMGAGSQFTVAWPLAKETLVTTSPPPARPGLPPGLAGTRVLVAEDNPINRDLMIDILTAVGCTVIEATDGRQALNMAQLERPDLMLLDIQLPLMDGIAVARAIRSDRNLESLPILAVSAQAMTEDIQRILDAGCDAYLAKPFTQEQFLAAVASLAARLTHV